MKVWRTASLAIAAATLAGSCAQPEDSADQVVLDAETPVPQVAADATEGPPVPDRFVETAWRTRGADGSRYITYLDSGGRYRDWRNGSRWQGGAWDRRADGAICFLPDGKDAQRRCWTPDRMTDQNHMVVVGGEEGARVELVREDYTSPEPDAEEGS